MTGMKITGGKAKILGAVLLIIALVAAAVIYPLLRARFMPSEKRMPAPEALSESARSLYRHVEALSSGIGQRSYKDLAALARTRDYITGCLRKWGYIPVLQPFNYRDREYFNIEASLEGGRAPSQVIVIGAHYDTVEGTPGADDNASAVAVLLDMCRLMKDSATARTVKFVFFCLEERPAFATRSMGSEVYALRQKQAGADIRGMICLEMVGYFSDRKGDQTIPVPLLGRGISTTPDFIGVIGNSESGELVAKVKGSLEAGCRVPVEPLVASSLIPGVDFSDHRSFWRAGYEAVMITDTAFYRNPSYHTAADTIETLDFEKMAGLLGGLIRAVQDLAE
jgi:hypothetical protein